MRFASAPEESAEKVKVFEQNGKIVSIDYEAIKNNILYIKKVAKSSKVFPVVKSNAYGHGLVDTVKSCDDVVDGWCVGTISEYEKIMNYTNKDVIVLKGYDVPEPPPRQNCIPVVFDFDDLEIKVRRGIRFFVKFDTGMGRLGFMPRDVSKVLKVVKKRPELLEGILTHFAYSDLEDMEFISHQIKLLMEICSLVKSEIGRNVAVSVCNSAGTLVLRQKFDIVRPGIAVYGVLPFGSKRQKIKLEPAMKVEAKVISVKTVPAGWSVGYSRKFVAKRRTKVAVLSIGYSSGLPRCWWKNGSVILNGKRCRIIGLISMDMTCVDATGTDVKRGDTALIMDGKEITAWDIAESCSTVAYEILCSLGLR